VNGDDFYFLGPLATKVYFFGSRPVLAHLQMRISPGPEATTLPVPFSIFQGQDNTFSGEIDRLTSASAQLGIPQGVSRIEVRVAGRAAEGQSDDPYQCIVKLDGLDITGTEPLPARYVPRLNVQMNRDAHACVPRLLSSKDL
jgi:hypothetical protein